MDRSWVAVAASVEVTTAPRAVTVAGHRLVVVRLRAGGPAVVFADRCPHRLVPLSAGTVDGGLLRCRYHGWAFDAAGGCADLPSLGPAARVPPRAHLDRIPGVREADGQVWLRTGDLPADPPEGGLTNLDPALLRAWHPVALADEVGAAPRQVMLVGRLWMLRRVAGRVVADPPPYGLRERWGVVWLAPEEPVVDLFDDPDAEDSRYVGAWLPPARTPTPAGAVADNFLDVAHFPFVHAGTFGAGEERVVPPYEVRDAGAVKTILFFVQPEHLISTRIYTKLLLYGIGGVARPDAAVVAREVAFEEAVLAEDLALRRELRGFVESAM